MEELDLMATDLSTSANEANDNMNKVGTQITSSVEDMKKIAQKLGTAVSPDLIKTSVEKGNEWLEQMKANDFTEDRASANEMYRASNELVQAVKEFAEPVTEAPNQSSNSTSSGNDTDSGSSSEVSCLFT